MDERGNQTNESGARGYLRMPVRNRVCHCQRRERSPLRRYVGARNRGSCSAGLAHDLFAVSLVRNRRLRGGTGSRLAGERLRRREVPGVYALCPADGIGTLLVSHAVRLGNGLSGGSGSGHDSGPRVARDRQLFPREPPRRSDFLISFGLGDLPDDSDFLNIFPKLIGKWQIVSNKSE